MSTRATWFCVDLEANGPVPGLYDLASIAAVVVAPGPDGRLATGDLFYAEMAPEAPRYDARAAAIHGLSLDHLRAHGLPRRTLCEGLAAWVAERTLPDTEPVFVGHNAPFDWSFVAWMYAAEDLPNPFGYKALCTKSLATGVLDVHWLESGKETIHRRLGLPPEDRRQKHRADYDALVQARILIGLLEYRRETAPPR